MSPQFELKIDEIVKDLKKVNRGEIDEQEARELFKDMSPLEISLAEQRLLEEGMDPDNLRKYCDLHLKAMRERKEELMESLSEGNPIRIAIIEHDHILEFLEELEGVVEELESGADPEKFTEKISHIAEHLVETEKHHEREEEVLFPLLEDRNVTGPPKIMRDDHDRMWPKKLRVKEISDSLEEGSLTDGEKVELTNLSLELIQELRDHIFKENNILYPTVVDNVESESEWKRLREEFDEIGYCCFTPDLN